MKKFSKIISIATAFALLFVSSSGNLKTIAEEIEIKAAETTLIGDISGNNRVDILDLIMTKSEVINPNSVVNKEIMDVTGDSNVDFRDAREIQQYLLSQNDNFTKNIRETLI